METATCGTEQTLGADGNTVGSFSSSLPRDIHSTWARVTDSFSTIPTLWKCGNLRHPEIVCLSHRRCSTTGSLPVGIGYISTCPFDFNGGAGMPFTRYLTTMYPSYLHSSTSMSYLKADAASRVHSVDASSVRKWARPINWTALLFQSAATLQHPIPVLFSHRIWPW